MMTSQSPMPTSTEERRSAGTVEGPPSRWRHLRRLWKTLVAGILALLILGVIGQLVRDRWAPMIYLFYLPLLPLGLGAVLLDLVCAGRCLPKPRFGLALIGLTAALLAAWPLLAWGPGEVETPSGRVVTLLQWNTQFGGHRSRRTQETWDALLGEILRHDADIVVLSEAPHVPERLAQLTRQPGWSSAQCEHAPGSVYQYRLVVTSPWPVRLLDDGDIPHGHVMAVEILIEGRPYRVLVMDITSDVRIPRQETIAEVGRICTEARDRGEPFAVVLGDCNTSARSVAFDDFPPESEDYRLASRSARGWRGTWPSHLPLSAVDHVWPLYDIDHVWLHKDYPLVSCRFFSHPFSDHRGHIVRFGLPAISRPDPGQKPEE